MYTDPVLEEKWRVQRTMSKESNYSLTKLNTMINDAMPAMQKKYNLKLRYSSRPGKCDQRSPLLNVP